MGPSSCEALLPAQPGFMMLQQQTTETATLTVAIFTEQKAAVERMNKQEERRMHRY